MIRLLRRLFGHKDSDGYAPVEREVFPFWDGKRRRLADPLAVHRAFLTDPEFDLKLDPGIAQVPTLDGLKATGRVAAAVRRAFGLVSFESGGLTDAECLTLFCEFGAYIGSLTEEGRPLASSPGPMASAPDAFRTATGAASG